MGVISIIKEPLGNLRLLTASSLVLVGLFSPKVLTYRQTAPSGLSDLKIPLTFVDYSMFNCSRAQ